MPVIPTIEVCTIFDTFKVLATISSHLSLPKIPALVVSASGSIAFVPSLDSTVTVVAVLLNDRLVVTLDTKASHVVLLSVKSVISAIK